MLEDALQTIVICGNEVADHKVREGEVDFLYKGRYTQEKKLEYKTITVQGDNIENVIEYCFLKNRSLKKLEESTIKSPYIGHEEYLRDYLKINYGKSLNGICLEGRDHIDLSYLLTVKSNILIHMSPFCNLIFMPEKFTQTQIEKLKMIQLLFDPEKTIAVWKLKMQHVSSKSKKYKKLHYETLMEASIETVVRMLENKNMDSGTKVK